ncbi:GNAT family N-acetyltransferase [Sneathiella sp. CAU 1612]|uniref:GNAT family N-acetyltransferase n=1 Tax=Sneathiella sedimenti TaxID=2816034 RepID=A0ABS3F5J2_9PROT|nr:GNAT family N-acetyltransferase [Sneathiella sedimenti]MBO0333623.1 GNAT family N-acetyltransferase [Sneathiella sedimenti]
MTGITIRTGTAADFKSTARLYFDSVRDGTAPHYNEEQRKAWAPDVPEAEEWRKWLSGMTTWVAETEERLIGFMSLSPNGHLELAFVHPDWIGKGIAARLYKRLEAHARATGMTSLDSDASLLARPFFERQGWHVVKEQQPVRHGVSLTNFRMAKKLVN